MAEFKGDTRSIIIKAKTKGIRIHTLKTLERSRTYAKMNETEKEYLVLNLIYGNPLSKSILPSRSIIVDKVVQNEGKTCYLVAIPDDFLHKKVDVLKIRLNNKTKEPTIEKHSAIFTANKTSITFDNMNGNTTSYFAIIHKEKNIALIKGRGTATL